MAPTLNRRGRLVSAITPAEMMRHRPTAKITHRTLCRIVVLTPGAERLSSGLRPPAHRKGSSCEEQAQEAKENDNVNRESRPPCHTTRTSGHRAR
jgi:hypothetical protein